jgi:hypothetical protein
MQGYTAAAQSVAPVRSSAIDHGFDSEDADTDTVIGPQRYKGGSQTSVTSHGENLVAMQEKGQEDSTVIADRQQDSPRTQASTPHSSHHVAKEVKGTSEALNNTEQSASEIAPNASPIGNEAPRTKSPPKMVYRRLFNGKIRVERADARPAMLPSKDEPRYNGVRKQLWPSGE